LQFVVSFLINFIAYAIIVLIGAMGGWETAKLIAHKSAEPSQPKENGGK
jgi:hypothetical protein